MRSEVGFLSTVSVEDLKVVVKPFPSGTFIVDKAEKDCIQRCPLCKLVKWGTPNVNGFFKTWNMCLLDSEHCFYRGKRVLFRVNHVVWNCPKIVGLPDRER